MIDPVKILIIEDELPIQRLIQNGYTAAEAHIYSAENGAEGLVSAAKHNPDIIILDLGLPDIDGQEVCRRLREWTETPIIVLSARGRERDKVEALDHGADDYMTKPFSVGELQARVRAALRHVKRTGTLPDGPFEFGALKVDLNARRVFVNENEVRLTKNEFKLLAMLVRHAGLVLTHKQLLEEVWGPAYADELHYLRVYMGQLRHKLEEDPTRPKYLRTESGVGYRLLAE
jgi:two-component system, OmpR family, KDP operon response regulator KdpE